MNKTFKKLTTEEREKIMAKKREEAISNLEYWYQKTDEGIFGMCEKLNLVSHQTFPYLTQEEKELFHKRYNWLVGFMRHFRLGDECLHLTKEVEILVSDQWS